MDRIGANEQAHEARIGSRRIRPIFEDDPHLLAGPPEAGWNGECQKETRGFRGGPCSGPRLIVVSHEPQGGLRSVHDNNNPIGKHLDASDDRSQQGSTIIQCV